MTDLRGPAFRAKGAPRRLRGLVTDIDGTLTDPDRHLASEAVEVLRSLEAQGTPVLVATGNVLPIALAIHRSIGLSSPIVAENGGLVYSRLNGRERVERLADRRIAWRAYTRARDAGLPVHRLFTDRWRETEVALESNVPVAVLRRAVRGEPVDIEATGFAVHLMERGKGKLVGVRHALAMMGIRLDECVVAGDGDNDVGMLRAAGYAVSFGGASRRARAAADFVARASHAAGFVEGIKRSGVLARPTEAKRTR